MEVKDLIELLKKCNPNAEVRAVREVEEDIENHWIHTIEESEQGESGYEKYGEVRLITNE